jgi:hypothetical protein
MKCSICNREIQPNEIIWDIPKDNTCQDCFEEYCSEEYWRTFGGLLE